MAIRLGAERFRMLADLRWEPTAKRVRAEAGGVTVADSRAAVLVWEPRRVVPGYAMPESDIAAILTPVIPDAGIAEGTETAEGTGDRGGSLPPVLDPRIGFAVHTSPGQVLDVEVGVEHRRCAAFRSSDPDLAGLVLLDFAAFDWFEEAEPIISHPHDPFARSRPG